MKNPKNKKRDYSEDQEIEQAVGILTHAQCPKCGTTNRLLFENGAKKNEASQTKCKKCKTQLIYLTL